MTANYNLLDEQWIPVLYRDGRYERVGIRKALEEAGQIRQVAASNPMDNVSLLRFLLAVLIWCKGELTENDLAIFESETDSIPKGWLKKLDEYKEKFNLLGDGERFYQDESILDELLKAKQKRWDDQTKKAKSQKAPKTPCPTSLDDDDFRPIGDLLVEFPTETKIAHFRHVRDKEYGLCPACCAVGIIRFCVWANAYGGGRYTSAVNGPTPAYAVARDSTLLRTFLLNWPKSMSSKREPPWICADPPKESDLDIVTVFAWRSRRLWLDDPEDEGRCSYCGMIDKLIRRHAFTGNWKRDDKKFWSADPHLILVDKKQAAEDSADTSDAGDDTSSQGQQSKARGRAKQTTLGFPSPGAKVTAHTRFWRRALSGVSARSNADESGTASVTVTGPAANKGLYQDAASVGLPRNCQRETIETMNKAVEDLDGVLRSSTPNPKRQHPERRAALDALSPSLEARLRQELSAIQEPKDVRERLQAVVRDVVSATTAGSPLRRREAMRCAESALEQALRKIASNQEQDSSTNDNSQANKASAAKPKRRKERKEPET